MTVKKISSARSNVVPVAPRTSPRVAPQSRVTAAVVDTGMAMRDEALLAATVEIETPYIAVLVPVLARPGNVAPLVRSFAENTPIDHARLYFVAQHSDKAEIDAIRDSGHEPIFVGDSDRSWARKINRGYENTTEPWILLGADDLRFHKGWTSAIADLLIAHAGVIGTNDLGNESTIHGKHSTHPLVRRSYARIMGTVDMRNRVVHEEYDHNYPDTELVRTARKRKLYIHRGGCIVEHLHPLWGKSKQDATYARGQEFYEQDRRLFERRRKIFGWE